MAKTFGTGKISQQYEEFIKRGDGVGRETEAFIIRNSSQSVEKSALYSINTEDNYSQKCVNIPVEIREF